MSTYDSINSFTDLRQNREIDRAIESTITSSFGSASQRILPISYFYNLKKDYVYSYFYISYITTNAGATAAELRFYLVDQPDQDFNDGESFAPFNNPDSITLLFSINNFSLGQQRRNFVFRHCVQPKKDNQAIVGVYRRSRGSGTTFGTSEGTQCFLREERNLVLATEFLTRE